ncbi:winged helix-turn-helix domain-containing protein [Prosthecomicrobium sp. N25]|uniref:winged helix-turn-helix domain-containing protein n=1 Tax=Prosthecomicrobium sp. N25 TaxID=3129254 RepID=UPI00307750E9
MDGRFSFGRFILDEKARVLTFDGLHLDIQPKVFDVLAYLVRNAGRVVPKSELMDAIWPSLHVTEASLQRAVSLARSALARGGLGDAIRSHVRLGYRFAVDRPDLAGLLPSGAEPDERTASAREACRTRRWAAAADAFAQAAATDPLGPEDLDLWAVTLECLARPSDGLPLLVDAVTRHAAAGRPVEAARSAINLARLHLERAETAVARGWLVRAQSFLDHGPETDAHALLVWMRARFAAFEGRPEEARDLAAEAQAIAGRAAPVGVRALTLAYLGFFNISLGRAAEGLEQQDHAAAMALSGQVDPIMGSLIYCNILWSCRSFADWSRGSQWSGGFETWCHANFARLSGACQLHRAEILGARGVLGDALAGIDRAIEALAATEPWALGDAYRVRGDIQAMRGDAAAAMSDYRVAYERGWDAEPGHAILLFEAGDTEGALSALDGVLAGAGWFSLQRRGWIVANKARIAALAGRLDTARDCVRELSDSYDSWPSQAIRAMTLEAQARIACEDDRSPTRLLVLARQLWTSMGADYQVARVRLELAEVLSASGQGAGALVEADLAARGAQRIGALRLHERARLLALRLAPDAARKSLPAC